MSKSRSVGTKLFLNKKRIGGLKSISGVEISVDTTEVTDLGNEDGYKEFLAAFKDGGEVSASGFLDSDDEGQDEVYQLINSGELAEGEIRFPVKIGKSWTFNAIVTKFATAVEVEGAVTFDTTLKLSGTPTLAATTE